MTKIYLVFCTREFILKYSVQHQSALKLAKQYCISIQYHNIFKVVEIIQIIHFNSKTYYAYILYYNS